MPRRGPEAGIHHLQEIFMVGYEQNYSCTFPMKIVVFSYDTEIVILSSRSMTAAAPEGTPPRRNDD